RPQPFGSGARPRAEQKDGRRAATRRPGGGERGQALAAGIEAPQLMPRSGVSLVTVIRGRPGVDIGHDALVWSPGSFALARSLLGRQQAFERERGRGGLSSRPLPL